jgi:hypothetical protein
VRSIINLSKQEAAKSNKDLILGMGWAIASRSLDMYESHPFTSTPAESCETKVQQSELLLNAFALHGQPVPYINR